MYVWILNTSECLYVYTCIRNIHKGNICLSIERRDKTPLRAPIIIIVSFTFYLSLIYIFLIKPTFHNNYIYDTICRRSIHVTHV